MSMIDKLLGIGRRTKQSLGWSKTGVGAEEGELRSTSTTVGDESSGKKIVSLSVLYALAGRLRFGIHALSEHVQRRGIEASDVDQRGAAAPRLRFAIWSRSVKTKIAK